MELTSLLQNDRELVGYDSSRSLLRSGPLQSKGFRAVGVDKVMRFRFSGVQGEKGACPLVDPY